MDGQSPSGFTGSSYTGMGSFNVQQGQDKDDDNVVPAGPASPATPVAPAVVSYEAIPVMTMLVELKDSFKNMRQAKPYGFDGLEFTTASALLQEMVVRYGKSSFIDNSEVEALVQ